MTLDIRITLRGQLSSIWKINTAPNIPVRDLLMLSHMAMGPRLFPGMRVRSESPQPRAWL